MCLYHSRQKGIWGLPTKTNLLSQAFLTHVSSAFSLSNCLSGIPFCWSPRPFSGFATSWWGAFVYRTWRFYRTRPNRQGLDWIVGPGYSYVVYLRPLGKVIIFRDKHNLPIIYRSNHQILAFAVFFTISLKLFRLSRDWICLQTNVQKFSAND